MVSATRSIGGKIHKLWGGVQISLSANDVYVSRVSRKPRKASMEVHALAIPSAEPMNCEGMPEVIRTWADTPLFWFQPGQCKQTAERATGGLNRQEPLVNADEEASIWSGGRILPAVCKISIQFSG